jgi:hypothetical protein
MKVIVDHLVKKGLPMTFRLSRFHEPVGSRFDSEALGEPGSSLLTFGRLINSGAANPPGNCEAISDPFFSSGVASGLGSDFGVFLSLLADSEIAVDGCESILLTEDGMSSLWYDSDSRIFHGEEYSLETGAPHMMKLLNSTWSRTILAGQGGTQWARGSYSDSGVVDNLSMEVEIVEISKTWPMGTSKLEVTTTESVELTVVVALDTEDSSCAAKLILLDCARANVDDVPATMVSAGRIACLGPDIYKAFSWHRLDI